MYIKQNTKDTSTNDTFTEITKSIFLQGNQFSHILKATVFDTVLGSMIAIGDEQALYLLDFMDRRDIAHKCERLQLNTKSIITVGSSAPIVSVIAELEQYFAGLLTVFKTPLYYNLGTSFQKSVWQELAHISYGTTKSYTELARSISRVSVRRAIANACGANNIAIVIPCHRVMRSNGDLGGYAGGIVRKQWLIEHERKNRVFR